MTSPPEMGGWRLEHKVATAVPGSGKQLKRRQFLAAAGAVSVASIMAGCIQETNVIPPAITVARWAAERGTPYLIGHRGAGDVVPEHTLESYSAALAWGAKALEVSVCRTGDGVLICHHDLTLDRTTTLTGRVSDHTIAEIESGWVDVPRLGPAWQGVRRPRVPRLDAVLDAVGGRAVLCIEAKDDAAYPAMVAMLETKGLRESAIIKVHHTSHRLQEAKANGLPVFAYLGSVGESTRAAVSGLAARLEATRDVLVLPGIADGGGLIADDVVRYAVATGVPIWIFPLHRRAELTHFVNLGVSGVVTSSIGYLAGSAPVYSGSWPSDRLEPGTLTRAPESDSYGLRWPQPGTISLAVQGQQSFVALGNLVALRQSLVPYRLDLEVRVNADPGVESNFSIAFGHEDDQYYEHKLGLQNGYHAMLTMGGGLELREHLAGRRDGLLLAQPQAGPPPKLGAWIPLRLDVSRQMVSWQRRDSGATVQHAEPRWLHNYIHIGRSSHYGELSVRGLRLTPG